jgi:hypothetical protein
LFEEQKLYNTFSEAEKAKDAVVNKPKAMVEATTRKMMLLWLGMAVLLIADRIPGTLSFRRAGNHFTIFPPLTMH